MMLVETFWQGFFATSADLLHITTKEIPVESAKAMTVVEQFHSPVRKAFNIIKKESPGKDDVSALQMTVKAIKDSVGPDGLVLTLLVFGALPRTGLPKKKPTSSTFQRAVALPKTIERITKHFTNRQVKDEMRTQNGPDVTDIHNAPTGSRVLVYHPEKDN